MKHPSEWATARAHELWRNVRIESASLPAIAHALDAARLAGFDAGKEAAAQVCEKYSEDAYDDDSSRAYGAAECATTIRALTPETK